MLSVLAFRKFYDIHVHIIYAQSDMRTLNSLSCLTGMRSKLVWDTSPLVGEGGFSSRDDKPERGHKDSNQIKRNVFMNR